MIVTLVALFQAAAVPMPEAPSAPPAPAAAPTVAVRIVPATPLPAAQPLICKSSIETGSLIAKRKQCLTKAQWRYVDDLQRQQTQQLFDDQRTKPGCGGSVTC